MIPAANIFVFGVDTLAGNPAIHGVHGAMDAVARDPDIPGVFGNNVARYPGMLVSSRRWYPAWVPRDNDWFGD